MNVSGFEESFQNSQVLRLTSKPVLDIRIASLPGLAVMKLVSWDDRYPERSKDASDLKIIIRSYIDCGNYMRIFDEMSDILETETFDYVSAGARLLGRDIAKIISKKLKDKIIDILNKETGEQDQYKLIEDMIRAESFNSGAFENLKNLLEEMKKGILDAA